MVFGLSLFAVFIAPLIALVAWIACILRLRTWFLGGLSLVLAILILFTSKNAVFVAVRNPYLMLVFMGLSLFNALLLPYADENDRRYMLAADIVLLVMIAALHSWSISLRQSDLYFYEHTNFGNMVYASLMSLLSIMLPVIAFVARPTRKNGFRLGIVLIIGSVVLAMILGFLFT